MSSHLIEREQFLASLNDLLRKAAQGNGQCALIGGEAGIGKTALTERFEEQQRTIARFLWGRCEALFTPRPLGPLHDIAPSLDGFSDFLAEHEANRTLVFSTLLSALQAQSKPSVVIIEDVHWADEATLDMIKFLGRRVRQASILLIVTYRDDEIGADHPLWFVFGDLPSRATTRLRIPTLSEPAVAQLAIEAQQPISNLYAITGGNPFFVTEALASAGEEIPETVRDAVLARASRLSSAGRAVLELAAVGPARTELWLIEGILGPSAPAIAECLKTGMLRLEQDTAAFRHELARQAILSAIPSPCQKELHGQVMRALLERGGEASHIARLVHHATGAQDSAIVLRIAPEAARQAAAQGAHREAASHYASALFYGASLPPRRRAELLEGRAYECYLTNQLDAALQARAEVLAIWQEIGDIEQVGHSQRWLSRLNWFLGKKSPADHFATAAVATLETLPPARELAWAYSNLAQLRMLDDDLEGTQEWGAKALDLARALKDEEALCHALNNVGVAEWRASQDEGRHKLEESLHIALTHAFEEHAARAYTNLASSAVSFRDYAQATRYLDEGIAYCIEHDLDSWRLYMTGWRALAHLDLGDWTAATEDANIVLRVYRAAPVTRITALVALASVRQRRGDPGSSALLDEARDLALGTGEFQRIAPVAIARAESAWLSDDLERCLAEAQVGFESALNHRNSFEFGQLCVWLRKAGGLPKTPDGLPEPYAAQLSGNWQHAATFWARLRCPYEQALALSDGNSVARREALKIFHTLDARATADCLTRRLHVAGVQHVPRGPRASTRNNPASLTDRQLEVLLLMAEGFSNSEIAVKLSASPRTIEHHTSAILAKLHARSRTQAVAAARNLGAIPNSR